MPHRILILTSSCPSNTIVEVNQRNLKTKLKGKGFAFDEIDGMDPDNHDLRSKLFTLSGLKGQYPQIFIKQESSDIQFIADYEKFESLLELETLPQEVLASNPDIVTFAATFTGCEVDN